MLDQVAGHVQFTLRAHYVLDTVLAEIVAADPRSHSCVARLPTCPRTRPTSNGSGSVSWSRRRSTHAGARTPSDLISRIAPLVEDWVAREVAGMDTMADYALLVSSDKQDGARGGGRGARQPSSTVAPG